MSFIPTPCSPGLTVESSDSVTITGDGTVGDPLTAEVILVAPNASRYRLVVANDGTLSTVLVV
jgi:hypothetical protein